ncbi:hypothetical protein K493DRAFT_315873 [Basidiobolus meristosporus CBS 931.73]|uniref:Uncharacterized protein n=1 Tax=Basidiobolus meristosporus CBS 931.73 TaxID=1314790 RepID=A0A1Y1Y6J9_9FUNG|nr:hypothetical protein K493DRAFT_315873 [Basidiobolus meristosporus CBS 931.73]|eukprot:ORX93651.1 hypothetical protein K493DRAFT_315873 [Basidiobolus meristosporus CBS 931.73]
MDTNWCTICDKHVPYDNDLYCSEMCRLQDTASHEAVKSSLTYQRRHSSIFSTSSIRSPSFKAYLPSPPLSPIHFSHRGQCNKISPPSFSLGSSAYR